MGRSHPFRLWCLALWAVALVAVTGGHPGEARRQVAQATPEAVGVLAPVADDAVLPPRTAEELRAISTGGALRNLATAAVLGLLVVLPAALRRRSAATAGDSLPLRSRRHSIALRAPPLQLA